MSYRLEKKIKEKKMQDEKTSRDAIVE